MRITYAFILSTLLLSTSFSAHAADMIGVKEMKECLATSRDKYTLYKDCIGKVTEACITNYDAYEEALTDISVGPPRRNCVERESIWWNELFKEYASKLQNRTTHATQDKRIINALNSDLSTLDKKPLNECGYETVRWGYRDNGDLVQIAGLDDEFRCIRDINAENAITVYLWSNQEMHLN